VNIGIICYASVGGSGIVATELGKAVRPVGHGDGFRLRAPHQPGHGPQVLRARSDRTIGQPQIRAPRRAEHRARRLGLGEPLVHRAVAAHLSRREIAQADTRAEPRVLGDGAAHADIDVVGVRAEHQQVHRHRSDKT
jgi:hypothetical protein